MTNLAYCRPTLASVLVSIAAAGSTVIVAMVPVTPAQAIIVFDPSNYTQNVLTAARTLAQINNQIRMLQNQAQSLANQAKNLATIGFPELQAMTRTIQEINQLMAQAQGIQFRVGNLDQQFRTLFPARYNQALTTDQHMIEAKARLETSLAAYKQTMTVQAEVVENVATDAQTLRQIVARSQGAEGALQVAQATNQLLALTAKQQFQIEHLMAAQYRAEAIEQARQAQAQSDARAGTAKFLGSGSAYPPR